MTRLVPRLFLFVLIACGGSQASTEAPGASEASSSGGEGTAPDGAPDSSSGSDAAGAEAGSEGAAGNEFKLQKSDSAAGARGVHPSKIKPSATEAAMKFFVVDKDKGPLIGIVIKLTAPDGKSYYTEETDAEGYAEVLVPVGKKYELEYLSLGRRKISASVPVSDKPNQNVSLTLRYKRHDRPPPIRAKKGAPAAAEEPRFILEGVEFDTGKATIRPDSLPRLDTVVEYMSHKKSTRIEISGHTDNVGNARTNQKLSEKRAKACREYLVSKGIDGGRIETVGYGDARPIASNDTEDGRQKNRRIEAKEL
ncbi:MAG: OmpA family protein [Myxococcales bacterium]|nr:OmpA family protein [Myxococcales bacterium]